MTEHQRKMDEGQAIQLAQRIGITDATELQRAATLIQRGETTRAITGALVEAQKAGIPASRVLGIADDHNLAVGVALRCITEAKVNRLKVGTVLETIRCLAERDGGIAPGHPEWQTTALSNSVELGVIRQGLPYDLQKVVPYATVRQLFDLLGSVDEVEAFLENVINAPRKSNIHPQTFYRKTIADRIAHLEDRSSRGQALIGDFD